MPRLSLFPSPRWIVPALVGGLVVLAGCDSPTLREEPTPVVEATPTPVPTPKPSPTPEADPDARDLYAIRVDRLINTLHQGELNVQELHAVRQANQRELYMRLYLKWEEVIVREMWAFADSLDIMEHWAANELIQLTQGAEYDPAQTARIAERVRALEKRSQYFIPIARPFLGGRNDYYLEQYDAIERRLAGLHYKLALLETVGGRPMAAEAHLARAREGGVPGALHEEPLGAEAGAGHLTPWMRWDIERRRAETVPRLMEELAGLIDQQKRSERVHGFGWRYLANDPELAAFLRGHEVLDDPRLMIFLRSFLDRYYGNNVFAASYFISDEAMYPREWIEAHQREWRGWVVEDVGPLVRVDYRSPDTAEVQLDGVLLRSERGDLWERPMRLVIRRLPDGRYTVLYPGSAQDAWERWRTFTEVLERRMRQFYFERQRAEMHRRAVDAERAMQGTD